MTLMLEHRADNTTTVEYKMYNHEQKTGAQNGETECLMTG